MQWSVLLPVVLSLIANQDGDTFVTRLGDFCYTKWALEAFLLANAKRYNNHSQFTERLASFIRHAIIYYQNV